MFNFFGSRSKKPVEEKKTERKKNYATIFTFSRDKLYFPVLTVYGIDGQQVSLYVTFEFTINDMEEFRRSDPVATEMMDELKTTLKAYRREYRSKDYYANGGQLILKVCSDLLNKHYPCINVGEGSVEVVSFNNN